MADESTILCEVEDGVAVLTLNRPERLNAFTPAMNDLYDELMVTLEQDSAVRAVVITGKGRGFCVGTDMAELKETSRKGASPGFPHPEQPLAIYDVFAEAPPELRSRYVLPKAMSKPVICAVNGSCAGVGLALAVACDVRFASREAVFTAIFARRGLTAETGLAFTLPAVVGLGPATDMLISGRRIVAEEAEKIGLVSRALPPDELLPHALAYARDVAANVSPRSVRVIKRQLWAAQRQGFMEAALMAYKEAGRSLKSDDFREGVAHFIEKRPPQFTGR
ncbi:MAG: enoyl-CoA hydratase/isomerase [Phenylobacterium sp.]|nr:enoyl-CoA hydratase/isomerase [Phenylobacterium sp.]